MTGCWSARMPYSISNSKRSGVSPRAEAYSRVCAMSAGSCVAMAGIAIRFFSAVEPFTQLIMTGVLERFPKLKIVLVENELGWIPFVLEQWDYYFKRHGTNRDGLKIKKMPSEYFHNQIYTTFFNDAVGGHTLTWWGQDNCMWSNDFPHGNSTWPKSRDVIARDLGPDEGLLIYPEGTRFSSKVLARAMRSLGAADPARSERMGGLRYVLPPRPGGALAVSAGRQRTIDDWVAKKGRSKKT